MGWKPARSLWNEIGEDNKLTSVSTSKKERVENSTSGAHDSAITAHGRNRETREEEERRMVSDESTRRQLWTDVVKGDVRDIEKK